MTQRINDVFNSVKSFITKGNQRSALVKKNIVEMGFYKGFSVLISFLLVPLTIDYVDSTNYGIWLTLSSMVGWLSFFDIGINNGLRNRLAEAVAKGDYTKAKQYVSSTYAFLAMIFIPLMIILLLVVPHIDIYSLIKISKEANKDLLECVYILIIYFCINFILSTVNVIYNAMQNPAGASLRTLVQQLASLIVIFILTKTTEGSLIKLCFALCVVPIIVSLYFNFALFWGKYKKIAPSIKSVEWKTIPDLMSLGIKFFVIQISGIIQFQLINFLIIRNYGPVDVSAYNISHKYFNALYMVWGIIITPLWSAVTDAHSKGEYSWIINAQKKYFRMFLLFLGATFLLLLISPFVYRIWIGDSIKIPILLSFWVAIYNLVLIFGGPYVMILTGIGELKIQFYASILAPFVFLGLCYLFIKVMNWGVYSIVVASVLSNFNGFLLAPVQYAQVKKRKFLSNFRQ